MFGAIEIAADCRRQGMLADAARERLVEQARPPQPTTFVRNQNPLGALQRVCASARGALHEFAVHTLGARHRAETSQALRHPLSPAA